MALTIAGSLARAGHHVDLVVVTDSGPLRIEVPTEVRVVRLADSVWPLRWMARRHLVRAAIPALAAYIRRQSPDVIIGGANHVSIGLAIAHRLARRPQTRLVLKATNPIGGLHASSLKRHAARLLFPTADVVVAVSAPIARDHAAALGSSAPHIEVIPEPALDRDFQRRLAAPPSHPWLASDTPLVVSIGRLVRQKGHAVLLEAFACVIEAHPAARLLVIGDGPLRGELEAQVCALRLTDRVAFSGEVANPLPALRFARCFVLPSRWEGLGIAAIEAAAAGCRIVATDTPAVRWALGDGALGQLVLPDDPTAMAMAITVALSVEAPPALDQGLLDAFSEAAVAARYGELIDDLCDRR